jgi:hypothetical protein
VAHKSPAGPLPSFRIYSSPHPLTALAPPPESTSRLQELIEYAVSRLLVSAAMIADELGVNAPRRPQPHRRVGTARGDREGTVPGVGNSVR